jgi:hypothetical protein
VKSHTAVRNEAEEEKTQKDTCGFAIAEWLWIGTECEVGKRKRR